eukprot:COSAG01_NODE_36545_length_516_cov_0.937650_1_plen_27_part_10
MVVMMYPAAAAATASDGWPEALAGAAG